MFHLTLGEGAHGTRVESLYRLVDVSGLVITVHGYSDASETGRAILESAPRLSGDEEATATDR